MNFNHFKLIRLIELGNALAELTKLSASKGSLLEIGAGAGWQAQELSKKGYKVDAIDIKSSQYLKDSIWPVKEYDGFNIPFPDNYFDYIFSSNVLEHIPHIEKFQSEIYRVLKNRGLAIHIVPSASWRFWTNITHYLYIPKSALLIIYNKIQRLIKQNEIFSTTIEESKLTSLSPSEILQKTLVPSRHGETGNSLTELYLFSRYRWNKLFKNSGWNIKKRTVNKLAYTGYLLFGLKLTIANRRIISSILGSSCHIYILEKKFNN